MKIICPEHTGLIEVPDNAIKAASASPLQSLVCHCPVCDEDILIENIALHAASPAQVKS